MKQDSILHALNDLDEKYIEEALERRPVHFHRYWLSAAACFVLFTVMALVVVRIWMPFSAGSMKADSDPDNTFSEGVHFPASSDKEDGNGFPEEPPSPGEEDNNRDPEEPSSPDKSQDSPVEAHRPGETVSNALGSVTCLSADGGYLTVRLTLARPLTVQLSIRGSYLSDDGQRIWLCATTDPEGRIPAAYFHLVTDVVPERLPLQIDGNLSPDGLLPTAAGTYEIVVDYRDFCEVAEMITDFCIDGFGLFALFP